MTSKIFILICILVTSFACNSDDSDRSQSADLENLSQQYDVIKQLSESVVCSDPADWNWTEIVNFPFQDNCIGPATYIAYSNKIDTARFLKLVADYNQAVYDFVSKYKTDCNIAFITLYQPPKSVECVDGKAQLIY